MNISDILSSAEEKLYRAQLRQLGEQPTVYAAHATEINALRGAMLELRIKINNVLPVNANYTRSIVALKIEALRIVDLPRAKQAEEIGTLFALANAGDTDAKAIGYFWREEHLRRDADRARPSKEQIKAIANDLVKQARRANRPLLRAKATA